MQTTEMEFNSIKLGIHKIGQQATLIVFNNSNVKIIK